MEYNLLKTIETNFASFKTPNETLPRLTPFPSTDYVNPGLGQISRLYSFYVPMYSNKNIHTLHKKAADTNAESLEGFGNVQVEENTENNESENIDQKDESDEINSQLQSNPLELNASKRKKLGAPVHEAFLHPKIIKTDKLFIKPTQTVKQTKQTASTSKAPKKTIKHKFEFV
jgi:hypothetical protein